MVGFDQDHSINTLVGGISPLVSLQIASKMKQERQERELQAPQAYLGIVSWTSRACAMALHFWLAPLSWAEQAGPPWSQATSTGRLCARNSPRVCRRCNTTFHWDAICVFPMFFPDFQLAESIHPLQSEPGLRILGRVETRTTQRHNSRNSSSNNNNLKKQNSKQRRQR